MPSPFPPLPCRTLVGPASALPRICVRSACCHFRTLEFGDRGGCARAMLETYKYVRELIQSEQHSPPQTRVRPLPSSPLRFALVHTRSTHSTAPAGRLTPNTIPEQCWQVVTTDLIPGLPESHGSDAIWVAVDRLTKRICIAPMTTEVNSVGVARLFRDHVWRNHGLPDQIISDRGPQFESSFMKDLYRLLGIEANPSTAYHPQTDGQTERINQEIEQYLRIYVNFRQNDWADWLAIAEFAYNDKVQASTGHSPFFVNHGRHPYKGSNPRVIARNESAQQFKERMGKVQEEVGASLKMAAETMKRFYDRTKGESIAYKKGDKVWLEATNITTKRPMKKLDDKRLGPFTIVDKVGKAAYKLKIPDSWRIHPVFNEVLLSPYHSPQFESQQRPPPPPSFATAVASC